MKPANRHLALAIAVALGTVAAGTQTVFSDIDINPGAGQDVVVDQGTVIITDIENQGPYPGQQPVCWSDGVAGPKGALGQCDPLPAGAQGPQGSVGPQGAQGANGSQGDPGPQGVQGATGPQGGLGLQGDPGPQGVQGATGIQGGLGPQGVSGPQGLQGAMGLPGPQGSPGATGPQGGLGPQGVSGPQGFQGATGSQGFQGPLGDPGPRGVQGVIGPKGDLGPQGISGPQGFQGALGSRGPRGAQGVQGALGPQGGFGPQGFQGAAGSIGSQGPQGVQGSIGPQGPQGAGIATCPVGTPSITLNSCSSNQNLGGFPNGWAECNVTIVSDVPVLSTGIILTVTADDKFSLGINTVGPQDIAFDVGDALQPYTALAYLTTPCGTSFTGTLNGTGEQQCLAAGTLVTLADGTRKRIEDVTYDDDLLVWDFDTGRFAVSRPLWIKRPEVTSQYNLLRFSDGSSLRTILQHRIFNKEAGRFTYPMSQDTPVGTTTFNSNGEEVTLVSKDVVTEDVVYHNIITNHHVNLFADSVLTSCRLNNLYPIEDMMFVRDDRPLRSREEFVGIPDKFYDGLRLSEQTMSVAEIYWYVGELQRNDIAKMESVEREGQFLWRTSSADETLNQTG